MRLFRCHVTKCLMLSSEVMPLLVLSRSYLIGISSALSPPSPLSLLIHNSSQLDRFATNNTCPLFYVNETDYGTVWIRQDGQIRPDSWRVRHKFPGDSNLVCHFSSFSSSFVFPFFSLCFLLSSSPLSPLSLCINFTIRITAIIPHFNTSNVHMLF